MSSKKRKLLEDPEKTLYLERFIQLRRDVSEIVQLLEAKSFVKSLPSREAKKFRGTNITKATFKDIQRWLTNSLERTNLDSEYCNNNCKEMYFCNLKKGHKGSGRRIGVGLI